MRSIHRISKPVLVLVLVLVLGRALAAGWFTNPERLAELPLPAVAGGGGGNHWAQEKAGTVTNLTGTTASILISPTAGSFVAVWYGFRSDTSQQATSITNVGGTLNNFVKDYEYTNYTTHYTLGFAHLANCPAGVTSVKITIPTSGSICLIVRSYTGQQTSPDPQDVTAAIATGSGSPITGANITTSAGSEAVFGLTWVGSSAPTVSAGTGWTKVAQVTDAGNGNILCGEERLNQAAGSYAASFTLSSGTPAWAAFANSEKGQ